MLKRTQCATVLRPPKRLRTACVLACLPALLMLFSLFSIVSASSLIESPAGRDLQPGERIEATAVATRIPANGDTPERMVWKLKAKPAPNQIVVGCERLKQRIIEELDAAEIGTGGPLHLVKDGNGLPLNEYLMLRIDNVDDLTITPPVGIDAPPQPSDEGIEKNVTLTVTYDPSCTAVILARAEIEISTSAAANNPLDGIPAFTFADADPARFAGRPAGALPLKLSYAAEDMAAAKKDASVTTDEQAHARVREELFKVAVAAFDRAREAAALNEDGKPVIELQTPQAQAAANRFEGSMEETYKLSGSTTVDVVWGDVAAELNARNSQRGSAEALIWVFSVKGLRIAEGVNIEIVEEEWETIDVQGESIASKLRKRRQRAYEKLNGSSRPALSIRAGRIATRPGIVGDIELINPLVESVDRVRGGPIVMPEKPFPAQGAREGFNVVYPVRRKKRAEMNLAFKAGGSYSKEDGATGLLGIEELNLLRLKESVALSAEGGGEVQKFRFSLTRPFARSEKPRLEIRDLRINAQILRDKDRRLGNLTPDEIAAREVGSSALVSFGYDTHGLRERLNEDCIKDEERRRTRFGFLADVGLNYRDVNIRDDDKLLKITGISRALLPQERTQSTTASFGLNAFVKHDFRKPLAKGIGELELRLRHDLRKGFHLFGADYEFWKTRTVVAADLLFGFASQRDMFLRYRHGDNRGSTETPIFELPLLGGADSVRGLEEGEFIGRKVSFDQFEAGANLSSVWRLFAGKGRLPDKPFCPFEDGTQPRPPFDFENLYVKVFFDMGRVSDSPVTISALPRRADGYGLAVELRDMMADESGRRLNLSIGYARSPQSRLHNSGLMFTGVSFDF